MDNEKREVMKSDLDRISRLILAVLWECEKNIKPGLHRQMTNEIKFLQYKMENKTMEESKC